MYTTVLGHLGIHHATEEQANVHIVVVAIAATVVSIGLIMLATRLRRTPADEHIEKQRKE